MQLIDALPSEQFHSLERKLAERSEAEWHKEIQAARAKAAADGIDEQDIQDAVNRDRYGR